MTNDQPKKTLSITRKRSDSSAAGGSGSGVDSVRGKKRVLKIAKPEPVKNPVQAKKKKPKKAPSVLRVNALDTEIGKLSKVWRSHSPLALGIEKQIFKVIADGQISASKRVVRALLHKHCNNKNYLVDVIQGAKRFNLDGSEAGECSLASEEHSRRTLQKLEVQKIVKR